MMEKPDGADLLTMAREVVLRELLPALPTEKAVAARMVASAIAIALRERQAGAMPGCDLAELARGIREGAHDPGSARHDEVRAFLHEHARLRARVSAPKVLPSPA